MSYLCVTVSDDNEAQRKEHVALCLVGAWIKWKTIKHYSVLPYQPPSFIVHIWYSHELYSFVES